MTIKKAKQAFKTINRIANSLWSDALPTVQSELAITVGSLLFVLFLVMQLLLAGRWWLWELTTVIPWYIIWMLMFVFVTVSIYQHKILQVLVLLLFFPYLFRISDIGASFFTTTSTSNSAVSLYNWNTEFWEDNDLEGFYQHIVSKDADVIHLQEAFHLISVNNVKTRLVEAEFQEVVGEEYKVIQFGELVTATKLPIQDVIGSDLGAFLRVDVEIDKRTVSFYNVHVPVHLIPNLISSPKLFFKDMEERFERRQVVAETLLHELQGNPNPKVISGDFNSQASMPLIHPFLDRYQDAYQTLKIGVPTSINLYNLKAWRIDYVFGDLVRFLEFEEVDPKGYSDHWGQLVKLSL